MNYQASIEIAAAPEIVFPFVADPAKRTVWMQKSFGGIYSIISTEFPNGFDESNPVGTKFIDLISHKYTQAVMRYNGEILRYSKPTLFEFRTEVPYGSTYGKGRPSPTRSITKVTFTLEPTGSGGTKLTWAMEDETVQSFGFLNFFFVPAIQAMMRYTLKPLKTMVEKI
ncbi:MAG: SRPBCC family protein [Patescibacteria group bacterium]|jgi:uncharacterized protein YndB with AHSA1/START domain